MLKSGATPGEGMEGGYDLFHFRHRVVDMGAQAEFGFCSGAIGPTHPVFIIQPRVCLFVIDRCSQAEDYHSQAERRVERGVKPGAGNPGDSFLKRRGQGLRTA